MADENISGDFSACTLTTPYLTETEAAVMLSMLQDRDCPDVRRFRQKFPNIEKETADNNQIIHFFREL